MQLLLLLLLFIQHRQATTRVHKSHRQKPQQAPGGLALTGQCHPQTIHKAILHHGRTNHFTLDVTGSGTHDCTEVPVAQLRYVAYE